MKYYPVFMDIKDRVCLVVGGGSVGARKALGLARSGARVRVVSPCVTQKLKAAQGEDLHLEARPYDPSDLDGVYMVFAATDNQELNRQIREDARLANILCNCSDGRDKGDFILPSVMTQGDLVCAVSTCGASPALSKKIRRDLELVFGPEYKTLLTLMANVRQKMLAAGHDPEGHKKILTCLVERDLISLISAGDFAGVDAILEELLGKGFLFSDLAVEEQ